MSRKPDKRFIEQRDIAIRESARAGESIAAIARRHRLGKSQVYNILREVSDAAHHDRYVGPSRERLRKAWDEWEEQRNPSTEDETIEGLVDVPMPSRRVPNYEMPADIEIVYFVQAESGGPVKIGASTLGSFKGRLSAMQAGNSERLVARRLVRGGYVLEGKLHRRFAEHRLLGEWFGMSEELERMLLPAEEVATVSAGSVVRPLQQ